jgi:hypothetical protein
VLLFAISADSFNGLRSKALLSRQRSESLDRVAIENAHLAFRNSLAAIVAFIKKTLDSSLCPARVQILIEPFSPLHHQWTA